MSLLTAHPAIVLAVTTGVALVMSRLGIKEGLLRMRSEPRRCPSCGQRLRSWTCWSCTRSRRT